MLTTDERKSPAMGHFRWTLSFLALLLFAACVSGLCRGFRSDHVLLERPYSFLCNASVCARAEWRKTFPTYANIATIHSQFCRIEKDFQDFECKGKRLLLRAAKYTDRGTYEFVCDEHRHQIQLDVLYAVSVSAVERESVRLACFSSAARDVTWLRNDELVLRLKTDGSIEVGQSYEGRVSLEESCLRTGNLSLSIRDIHSTDGGLYRCFVDEETTKGEPHACVLHVNGRSDSSCTEQSVLILYQTLTAVFGLLSLVLIFVLIRQHGRPAAAAVEQMAETVRWVQCVSDTSTHGSVQESSVTEEKLSTTRPFL